jgi:porphobilinogen synthase
MARPMPAFPRTRMRRTRQMPWLRSLVAEHRLTVDDLVWPVFVHEGSEPEVPVASMPGVSRYSLARVVDAVKEAADLGIRAVAVFPATDPAKKTPDGEEALNPENLVCRTLRALSAACPGLGLVADVALDPYTTHGQDGLVREGVVVNDETLAVLRKQAVLEAQCGANMVAPSDMMDGRIGAVREALDEAKLQDTAILAYSAKYASAYYGPFRDAVGSKGNLGKGDKRTYQMDSANTEEALREVALDIEEGADAVMVKPGQPYLDIVRRVKDAFHVPTFVYQVSGEYAMIQAAAERGWVDGDAVLLESLLSFKRAGADAILTYGAVRTAKLLAR